MLGRVLLRIIKEGTREREKAAGSQLNSNSQHGYHPGRKTGMLKQSYGWRQNPGKAKKQVNVTAKADKSGITWRAGRRKLKTGERTRQRGSTSTRVCCSSCDAGQCSVTEPVMSIMQHATKVILHKPPFKTSRQDAAQGQRDTTPPPTPPFKSHPSFPRCTGAVRARR